MKGKGYGTGSGSGASGGKGYPTPVGSLPPPKGQSLQRDEEGNYSLMDNYASPMERIVSSVSTFIATVGNAMTVAFVSPTPADVAFAVNAAVDGVEAAVSMGARGLTPENIAKGGGSLLKGWASPFARAVTSRKDFATGLVSNANLVVATGVFTASVLLPKIGLGGNGTQRGDFLIAGLEMSTGDGFNLTRDGIAQPVTFTLTAAELADVVAAIASLGGPAKITGELRLIDPVTGISTPWPFTIGLA